MSANKHLDCLGFFFVARHRRQFSFDYPTRRVGAISVARVRFLPRLYAMALPLTMAQREAMMPDVRRL